MQCKYIKIVFLYIIQFHIIWSQSLENGALIKSTYFGAKSAMLGHANTALVSTPMNVYYNPAGLSLINSQKLQFDGSLYLNTAQFSDSETHYAPSFNAFVWASPFSSNSNTFKFAVSIRKPLLSGFEYQFQNNFGDASYEENNNLFQIGGSIAQELFKHVHFGFTYSYLTGEKEIIEKNSIGFSSKIKRSIKIKDSPNIFAFGLIYLVNSDLILGLTWQHSSAYKIKDNRIGNTETEIEKEISIAKFGINYTINSLTQFHMDTHFLTQNSKTNTSYHFGFNLDIFEDLGFAAGLIVFEQFKIRNFVYTTGLFYDKNKYRFYISLEHSQHDQLPYYFNHTVTSKYLLQASTEYQF